MTEYSLKSGAVLRRKGMHAYIYCRRDGAEFEIPIEMLFADHNLKGFVFYLSAARSPSGEKVEIDEKTVKEDIADLAGLADWTCEFE
jgi:hypothetical protein